MARNRLDKTLADYVVIAISPALVMTLVGSLVFFLLDVSYRGQFESRIHWIMFWYVFAAVLVARIAIIEGREHAQIFGLVMCGLAAIAVFRFVDAVIVGWLLLAVVWWCSSKLTWDCTLIDESEDASGEGLLQSAGFDKVTAADTTPTQPQQRPPDKDSKKDRKSKPARKRSRVDAAATNETPSSDSPADKQDSGQSQPHAPGLWVVYFSLAALPLFGVGQLFIPVEESGRRSYEFVLLAVYVASAILLLLTTSFLGLRRYLRQRKLSMPASMTRSWLGIGTALVVSLLLVALFVPRPQGEYTLTGLIDKIDAKARQASRFAVLKGDRAEGPGANKVDQDPNAKQSGDQQPPKPSGKGEAGGKNQGNAPDGKQNGDAKTDNQSKGQPSSNGKSSDSSKNTREQSDKKSDENQRGNKTNDRVEQQKKGEGQQSENRRPNDQKQNAEPDPSADKSQKGNEPKANPAPDSRSSESWMTNVIQMVAPFVKWILYGVLAIVGIYFMIRYWSGFVEFLARLWAEFLSLFIRRPDETDRSETKPEAVSRPLRPFASYENPFYSGAADRMSPPQLIRYTFEALEAWSREQSIERSVEQTPIEFAQELGQRVPALAKEVAQTAQLYAHVAYARKIPSRDRLEVLERLWRRLIA